MLDEDSSGVVDTAAMAITPPERFRTALSGGTPDRVPTYPKIWLDLAAALTGTDPINAIEDLVETGLDCIGPLDPLGGVDCARVRELADGRIALMGGVNTLSFAGDRTDRIEDETGRCIRAAGAGGAFIVGSGCALPRNSRRRNLEAFRRAAELYGTYDEDGNLLPPA